MIYAWDPETLDVYSIAYGAMTRVRPENNPILPIKFIIKRFAVQPQGRITVVDNDELPTVIDDIALVHDGNLVILSSILPDTCLRLSLRRSNDCTEQHCLQMISHSDGTKFFIPSLRLFHPATDGECASCNKQLYRLSNNASNCKVNTLIHEFISDCIKTPYIGCGIIYLEPVDTYGSAWVKKLEYD